MGQQWIVQEGRAELGGQGHRHSGGAHSPLNESPSTCPWPGTTVAWIHRGHTSTRRGSNRKFHGTRDADEATVDHAAVAPLLCEEPWSPQPPSLTAHLCLIGDETL